MDHWKKLKFAWKYRRPLRRYRGLLRHRREIAAGLMGLAAIAAVALGRRSSR